MPCTLYVAVVGAILLLGLAKETKGCLTDAVMAAGVECEREILSGKGAKVCCETAEVLLGKSSGHAASCLCEAGVLESIESPTLPAFLASCNSQFGSEIGYLGGGESFCPKEIRVLPPQRQVHRWLSDLGEEPILLWTTIMAVPGTLGVLAFLWAGVSCIL